MMKTMTDRRVTRSLGWHFSVMLIGVVSLIIAAFMALMIWDSARALEANLRERVMLASKLAQNSLPIPIWELNVEIVDEFLSTIFADPDIVYVGVDTPGVENVVKVNPEFSGYAWADFTASPKYVTNVAEIVFARQALSTFYVAASTTNIYRALRLRVLFIVLGLGSLLAAIALTCLIVAKRSIEQPLAHVVRLMTAIADGDLNPSFPDALLIRHADNEIGSLLRAFQQMDAKIRQILQEMQTLLTSVRQGDLRARGEAAEFTGSWQELVVGMNRLIDAFVAPIDVTAESLERMSRGEIPETISEESQGDFQQIQQNLNRLMESVADTTRIAEAIADGDLTIAVTPRSPDDRLMEALAHMIDRLRAIALETTRMIQTVQAGDLEIRGDADAFEGGWQTLIEGINSLIQVLRRAVTDNVTIHQEMELARRIQTALLPDTGVGIHPDFEIAAVMLPADEVGGDYYDVLIGKAGALWLGIGDVSGHGVTPGLIMMIAQTIKTTLVTHLDVSPKEMLTMLNAVLYYNVHERLNSDLSMTFTALRYQGGGRFEYAGAHLDLIVYRQTLGTCQCLATDGVWLNLLPDIADETPNAEFTLDVGDTLVLYTDGLIEARQPDGNMLDTERFLDIVAAHAAKEPKIMRDAVLHDVLAWSQQERADDMSLVIVRRIQ